MTRGSRPGKEYCFRCGERAVWTVNSRPGDAAFPWRRRRRECRACGSRWSTLEILAPGDPLAAEFNERRAIHLGLADAIEAAPSITPLPGPAPLAWTEVRTWA
jgi:hypothetical protein